MKKEYLKHKEPARVLVLSQLEHFEKFYAERGYELKVGRVSIRNQKTRWGSCSRRGDRLCNLNFNYRVALLPPRLCDYVVVHELCHTGQFNHSRKFWDLVALAVPDYLQIRAELKKKSLRFGWKIFRGKIRLFKR